MAIDFLEVLAMEFVERVPLRLDEELVIKDECLRNLLGEVLIGYVDETSFVEGPLWRFANDVLASADINVVTIEDKLFVFSIVSILKDVSVILDVVSAMECDNGKVEDAELDAEEKVEVPTFTDSSSECVVCFAVVVVPCSKWPEVVRAPVVMVVVCDFVVSVLRDVVVS